MAISVGTVVNSGIVNSRPVDVSVTLASPNDGLIVLVSTVLYTGFPPTSGATVTFDPGGANEVVLSGDGAGLIEYAGPQGQVPGSNTSPTEMVWHFTKAQLPASGTYTVRYADSASGAESFGTVVGVIPISNGGIDVVARQSAIAFNNLVTVSSITSSFPTITLHDSLIVAVAGNSNNASQNIPALATSVYDLAGGSSGDGFCASYQVRPARLNNITTTMDSGTTPRMALVSVEFAPSTISTRVSPDGGASLPPKTRGLGLLEPCDGLIVVVSTGSTYSTWPLDTSNVVTFDPGGANEVIKSGTDYLIGTGYLGPTGSIAGGGLASSIIYFFSKDELPSSGNADVTYSSNNTTDGTMICVFGISNGGNAVRVRQAAIGYTNGVSSNTVTASFASPTAAGSLVIAVGTNSVVKSMNIPQLTTSLFDIAEPNFQGNSFICAYENNPVSYTDTEVKIDDLTNVTAMTLAVIELETSWVNATASGSFAYIAGYSVFASAVGNTGIRMLPNTISLTSLSGTSANIDDDPDSPDGEWLVQI